MFHGKGAKSTQLDPVPARQSSRDLVKNSTDDPFHVTLEEMRISLRNACNEFRLGHPLASLSGRPVFVTFYWAGACEVQERESSLTRSYEIVFSVFTKKNAPHKGARFST